MSEDHLICKTCRGNKVIKNETGSLILCPRCKGTGEIQYLFKENVENTKKLLLENA